MTSGFSSSMMVSEATELRISGEKTPVLNWGVTSLETEGVVLERCAACASRKSFVLATARSSRRDVAASSLQGAVSSGSAKKGG
jgi:hypothetical protein